MTDQMDSPFNQQRPPQRNVRPFNTPKSPLKMGQPPTNNVKPEQLASMSRPNSGNNKDTNTYVKSELDEKIAKPVASAANMIQQPEILKVPTTPTKKNKASEPKTPVK